jgi:hypothetical protein
MKEYLIKFLNAVWGTLNRNAIIRNLSSIKLGMLYYKIPVLLLIFTTIFNSVSGQTPPPVDLTAHITSTAPSGSVVEWHNAIPLNSGNLVANAASAGVGTYYVAYYDAINGCYSPYSAVIVTTNVCPDATVDLSQHLNAGTPPSGTTLEWHNALPIAAGNLVSVSTAVGNGTYYAVYRDNANACYSPASTPVVVTIATCMVANNCTTAPTLSATTKSNTCPAMTVDLSTITASNVPAGTSLTWHSGTPATFGNKLSSVAAVGAGTYYAAICDMTAFCYGPTTTVAASLNLCPTPINMACNNYSGYIDHVSAYTQPIDANATKYVMTTFAGAVRSFCRPGTAPP